MRVFRTASELTAAPSREISLRLLLAEALALSGAARGFVWLAVGAQAGSGIYRYEANGATITEETDAPWGSSWEPALEATGPILLTRADPLFAKFARLPEPVLWMPFRRAGELKGGLVLESPRPDLAAANLGLLDLLVDSGKLALEHALLVERLAARNQYLSDYDDLVTKLPNRVFFKRRAQEAARRGTPGRMAGMLFLDLDNFERVNRDLGHSLGDQFLATAANRLLDATAGCGAFVGRLGGDEFGVHFDPNSEPSRAVACTQALVRAFHAPLTAADHQRVVTISVGLAWGPKRAESAEDWIHRAERAMYAAKSRGRNAYCVDSVPEACPDLEPSRTLDPP